MRLAMAAAVAAWLTVACSVPLATELDEQDANEIVGTLAASGIACTKRQDSRLDGSWTIFVARGDAAGATELLRQRELPPRRSPGLLETLGEDALLPSPTSERARWAAGTAAELERSLMADRNVLSARVHLALGSSQPLFMAADSVEPTASVLLRYASSEAPIRTEDVQRLVAGAVPGLAPGRVEVVVTRQTPVARGNAPLLARFGPFTVTRSALRPLRYIIAVGAAANLLAVGLAVFLWLQLRRLRRAGQAQNPESSSNLGSGQ